MSHRLIGQFLYNRELAKVVGNQQIVVITMLEYVNSQVWTMASCSHDAVLVVHSVEQACISCICHII